MIFIENSLFSLYATNVSERKLKAVLSIIRYVYKFIIPDIPFMILPQFIYIMTVESVSFMLRKQTGIFRLSMQTSLLVITVYSGVVQSSGQ